MDKPWLKHYEPGVPANIFYPRVPLQHFLEEAARQHPTNTALIFHDAKITYQQLNALADKFASALVNLGVKKGDRVALYLPNCPQFVLGFYGALKAGAVAVPINTLYVEREVQHQINDAGAETILVLSRYYPLIQKMRAQTGLQNVIATNIKEYFTPLERTRFTLTREQPEGHRVTLAEGDRWLPNLLEWSPAAPRVIVEPDDTAIFQYTGGMTGVPKAAMGTHRNLVANSLQMRAWFTDLRQGEEVVLTALPFFHIYGLVFCLCFAVQAAGTMLLMSRFEVDEALELIASYRPTIFPGVPTMYVAINKHPQVTRYDIRSIRACLSGAAPLPVEVKNRFEQLTGGKLCEAYGLSETPTATHCNPIRGLNKAGSIGLPLPDVECRIVDLETGSKDVQVGEIGELVLRGPNVMKGYWNMPQETRQVLRDGWLYTGDIARMYGDCYFYIVDRKKDIIIAGGFNIYPGEIEAVLGEHPKVQAAVVAGVSDEYRGETVRAYVMLKHGEKATAEEISEFCRQRLARYKVPTAVEFRDTLPRGTGKVLRRAIVEEERRQEAPRARPPQPPERLVEEEPVRWRR